MKTVEAIAEALAGRLTQLDVSVSLDPRARRLGQDGFDCQAFIDPDDKDWLPRTSGFILRHGADGIVVSNLELPSYTDKARRCIHQGLSLRELQVFDIQSGNVIRRIDMLFKAT